MMPIYQIVHWKPQDYIILQRDCMPLGALLPNLHVSMQTTTKSASRQQWLFLWAFMGDSYTIVRQQIYDDEQIQVSLKFPSS